ncbi:uncharacterized protein EV154DRAFT_522106 [Mucor mucedo]|uniref:uncharacterized protein n=1 Tax=Mucor mucedo TaxID=29922 RepID=UPI00221E7792|nr:uncharacterized protein EV154DRAFT_522106 [Mucor mucedo]KAI7884750.1 hypothetical protein EV154DRAFT_522106 [Mucor mucedo]
MNYYDYSQHKYCLVFGFDRTRLFYKSFVNDVKRTDDSQSSCGMRRASIVYNIKQEYITCKGDQAETFWESNRNHDGHCYVHNVFMELHDTSLKYNENPQSYDLHVKMVKMAAKSYLEEIARECQFQSKKNLEIRKFDYHYAMILPTSWDFPLNSNYCVKEDMFRPLFVEANMITTSDDHNRLLFFTMLDSNFRYLQFLISGNKSHSLPLISDGKQYIMCTLDFLNHKQHIDLDLFSAHKPFPATVNNNFSLGLLMSRSLSIPLSTQSPDLDIDTCLRDRGLVVSDICIIKLTGMYRGMLKKMLNPGYSFCKKELFPYNPFKTTEKDLRKYNLNEEEIRIIQSITIEDVLKYKLKFFEDAFKPHMEQMIDKANKIPKPTMIIAHVSGDDTIECRLVHCLFSEYLRTKANELGLYDIMPYDKVIESDLYLETPLTVFGGVLQIKEQIQTSNKHNPPTIIPGNQKLERFKNIEDAGCMINIDFTLKTVEFSIEYVGSDCRLRSKAENFKCDLKPIESFFVNSEIYRRPLLLVHSKILAFIKSRQQLIKKIINNQGDNLYQLFSSETILDECFSRPNTSKPPKATQDHLESTADPFYIHSFLILYLIYLNKLITLEVNRRFGGKCRNKNMGYVLTVQKKLLGTLYGSKKNLKGLLFTSGFLSQENECRKVRIFVRGEGCQPGIENYLQDLNFNIKSYFVTAQVHESHIQVSLHQVVGTSSIGEHAATIILKDKLINMDDVNDVLDKKIWLHTLPICPINYCCVHVDEETRDFHDYCSLQNYTYNRPNIRQLVLRMLKANEASIDFDTYETLNIGYKCCCSIDICLRDIIEFGLKPVIEGIATVVTASLSNTKLFGNFTVNFLFVMGNVFNLRHDSAIYKTYALLLHDAINQGIESKGRDTTGIVLEESFFRTSQTKSWENPFMSDSFYEGNVKQVSKYTYGIQIKQLQVAGVALPFLEWERSDDSDKTIKAFKDDMFVIIQKGQPIPKDGFVINLTLCSGYKPIHSLVEDSVANRSNTIDLDFLKIADTKNAPSEGSFCIGPCFYDKMFTLSLLPEKYVASRHIIIQIKNINHDFSIRFSAKMTGDNFDHKMEHQCTFLEQPLTLAYI